MTPLISFSPRFMKFFRLGVFLWCAPHVVASGELRAMSDPAKAPKPRTLVWRYEVETGQKFRMPPGKSLEPERIYVVYSRPLAHWVFTMTDGAGNIPKPGEALASGTVVKGSSLGGDKGKHYQLTPRGKWVVTKDPLQRRVWSLGEVPEFHLAVPFREGPARRPAAKASK
jgi:hypothetical protein